MFLFQKGVHPYEDIDDWEKSNETLLPEKEDFYSHLHVKDITDADYTPAKRVCKDFKRKKLWFYHYLHVQSNTLLLADAFEDFRNKCLETYELNLAILLILYWIIMENPFKKSKVKLDLLKNFDMLLMVEKCISSEIFHAIHQNVKNNNKYMKNYDENKQSLHLKYWDENVSEVNFWGFKCLEDTSQFNKIL